MPSMDGSSTSNGQGAHFCLTISTASACSCGQRATNRPHKFWWCRAPYTYGRPTCAAIPAHQPMM
eukprot:7696428-Pyramimonas_sp.AAC.1